MFRFVSVEIVLEVLHGDVARVSLCILCVHRYGTEFGGSSLIHIVSKQISVFYFFLLLLRS